MYRKLQQFISLRPKNIPYNPNIKIDSLRKVCAVSYQRFVKPDPVRYLSFINNLYAQKCEASLIFMTFPGKEQAVYDALKNKNPHLQVFWRADVPQSLNYNLDNGRIAPLILIAENRWSIVHKASNGTGVCKSSFYLYIISRHVLRLLCTYETIQ